MEKALKPARAVTCGRILTREMEARGWTQQDLARIMGRPALAINEIVNGTRPITAETALELAVAFDTSTELWTNLEVQCRLALG